MKLFIVVILCFCFQISVFADYGAAISAEAAAAGNGETNVGGYVTFAPWLSLPVGSADFIFSTGLSVGFGEKIIVVPEIFRLEILTQNFRAGRIFWQDGSGFIARGFLDGVDTQVNLGSFSLGAGAFYTGLLFKDTANINITPGDPKNYNAKFDWSDFSNTYFAPSRFIVSAYGEFPGFPYMRGQLYAGLIAQFDMSKADKRLSSYYLYARNTFGYRSFDFTASGAVSYSNGMSFALFLEGGWQTGMLNDRLSMEFRWASGEGNITSAFFPITRISQGTVLRHWFSGIMMMRIKYEARFLPELSGHISGRYYLRTDDVTFKDPFLENNSYSLGIEFDAGLIWVPYSDLSFSLGAGVFAPTGAMRSDAPVRWSVNIAAIFSF